MKKILIFLLITLFLTSACASKYGKQITDANYYPNCYRPIAELRESETNVQTGTAAGMGIGAVLGALVGALATGKAKGAIVGAAAGAAVGGVTGYAITKHSENMSADERLDAYSNDMNKDIQKMNIVTASASRARQCYENSFAQAKADFLAKNITKQEFEARYNEIRNGLTESSRILGNVSNNMQARDREYKEALLQEANAANNAPSTAAYTSTAPSKSTTAKKTKSTRSVASRPSSVKVNNALKKTDQFSRTQSAVEQERQATDKSIEVFDKNAHDLMGIGA